MSSRYAAEVVDWIESQARLMAEAAPGVYPTETDALMAVLAAETPERRADYFYALRNARNALLQAEEEQRTAALSRDFGMEAIRS